MCTPNILGAHVEHRISCVRSPVLACCIQPGPARWDALPAPSMARPQKITIETFKANSKWAKSINQKSKSATIVTRETNESKKYEQYEQHTIMAKSKNENCKLRHNTFEKDLSIIHIMLGAAKECLRCIAPFFVGLGGVSGKGIIPQCCFALKSHAIRWGNPGGLWERYVA